MTTARSVIGLVVSVALCLGTGLIGSLFTARSVGDWYVSLSKPAWTPPSWVFGPVWSALYVVMGIAAWLVWRQAGSSARTVALVVFALQLALNAAWSAIFFGLRMPGWAFGEIVVLWAAILCAVIAFWRVNPVAAWLLLPYLAWVSFASVLNFAIWRMNG
ncbi:MAG: tryptophan-rich sensory protein [Armatimonadota bacterium]|nr:MAG: tryptophan-rich sensory protein [Armatimonadota bacterium]